MREQSFGKRFPKLAKELHPTKNGTLNPYNIFPSCSQIVWWFLPYDDPITGKHFDFEWKESIRNRALLNYQCPFLTNKKVWPGYNDLETQRPDIAKEWHPTKNGLLKPYEVTTHCSKRVWWYKKIFDNRTKKIFEFEWESTVHNRTTNGAGCPYLTGKSVWKGYNDLKTLYPHIAKEWHPTKNGFLHPDEVTYRSGKKVWWYLKYYDDERKEWYEFEWMASISSRTNGNGCPYLNGKAVWQGYNDLETLRPDIAKEWHPTKNGKLKADEVTISSNKKVWWYLPYDDPITGKHFEFEWQETIYNRCIKCGCPYLTGHKVWRGYNDLETLRPDIAKEWHPTKNGKLKADEVTISSNKKVWWYLPYDDPITGKHFEFEWQNTIVSQVKTSGNCPYLQGQKVWSGYNDLLTKNQELAKQFHPTKNGKLTANKIMEHSHKIVWWIYSYDDPITGKHYDFEWKASPHSRATNMGCPHLSGKRVWPGFNDLETIFPEIANEWDYEKNRVLPNMVSPKSNIKRWWICEKGHKWKASPANRAKGRLCPLCLKN